MEWLINILKSRGKLGGVGLMVVGIGQIVLVFMGKLTGGYEVGITTFLAGLSLLGIRSAQDPAK